MDTGKLKTYAPKARRDFIAAVTRRAAKFGLTGSRTLAGTTRCSDKARLDRIVLSMFAILTIVRSHYRRQRTC